MIYAVSRDSVLSSLSLILLAYLCVRVCWRGGGCVVVWLWCASNAILGLQSYLFLRLYVHIFVDFVKRGVLAHVHEIPCYRNDHYFNYYCYQLPSIVHC